MKSATTTKLYVVQSSQTMPAVEDIPGSSQKRPCGTVLIDLENTVWNGISGMTLGFVLIRPYLKRRLTNPQAEKTAPNSVTAFQEHRLGRF
jgi:hypothetical protein